MHRSCLWQKYQNTGETTACIINFIHTFFALIIAFLVSFELDIGRYFCVIGTLLSMLFNDIFIQTTVEVTLIKHSLKCNIVSYLKPEVQVLQWSF